MNFSAIRQICRYLRRTYLPIYNEEIHQIEQIGKLIYLLKKGGDVQQELNDMLIAIYRTSCLRFVYAVMGWLTALLLALLLFIELEQDIISDYLETIGY